MAVQLPVEILEHIFQFLDGRSFCKLQEVCKAWKDIIKGMQTKKTIWKQFCFREIPCNIMEDILNNKSVPDNVKLINWSSLYKKWFRSRMVVEASSSLKSIYPSVESQSFITCLKLSGSRIITGHSSGHFCLWDQHTGDNIAIHLCHLLSIVDIALIDLLSLGSNYIYNDFPCDHHHAITISKDTYIRILPLMEEISENKISPFTCHSRDLTEIRVFDKNFVVASSDNSVSIYSMELQKKPVFHLKYSWIHTIIGPDDVLLNLGLWHEKITCISYSGKVKTFKSSPSNKIQDIGKNDVHEWIDGECLKNCYVETRSKVITFTDLYLYQTDTVIMFTNDGRMIISVDKMSNQYHLMRNIRTLITCVELKGTLLVLGGENGNIYVFHVPETKDLLQLDLSSPSFSLRLSQASITSLDITYSEESPVILASTNASFFVVKWYSDLSSQQAIKPRKIRKTKK